jgi:hypothetical protein
MLVLVVAAGAGAYALGRGRTPPRAGGASAGPSREQVAPAPAPPPSAAPPSSLAPAQGAFAQPVRFLAVGGGATPESTEVSLEQNLALLAQVLPGPGALLLGGGPGSSSVRVLDDRPVADPLLVRLGDLFQPRSGRHSRYRASELAAGGASLAAVESALAEALARGDEPLILYFAAHGEQGEHPSGNAIVLWGGGALDVVRLAELHDAHPRPLCVISASCFSGGFAELAFAHADAERGPARAPRCGLFAGTWDRETSGCDPDPDRRRQEGYSLHFLQGLRGRDRHGVQLPGPEIDFDGDGRVSLLEAHTRAAIAARSIDVPTTTSQRYLRAVERAGTAIDRELLPEEQAVTLQLGAVLGLLDQLAVTRRQRALAAQLDALDAKLQQADRLVDQRYGELAARLLGRWPVLDDAYHPEFAATLERDRAEIAAALDAWPEARHHLAAERERAVLEADFFELEVEDALVARLLRAHETQRLAAALRKRRGAEWQHYQELLACERRVITTP